MISGRLVLGMIVGMGVELVSVMNNVGQFEVFAVAVVDSFKSHRHSSSLSTFFN